MNTYQIRFTRYFVGRSHQAYSDFYIGKLMDEYVAISFNSVYAWKDRMSFSFDSLEECEKAAEWVISLEEPNEHCRYEVKIEPYNLLGRNTDEC